MIKVTVTIDFGPADRQSFEAVVTVPEKSTVLDVLLNRLPVTTSPRYGMDHFVEEIDGMQFRFDHGQRVQCGSWFHIVTAVGASMRIVDEILGAPRIKALAVIPDEYAAQRAADRN